MRKKHDRSNVFIGFTFLGMGLGWLLGHLAAGLFIGLGLGFIAQALLEEKDAPDADTGQQAPTEGAPVEPAAGDVAGQAAGGADRGPTTAASHSGTTDLEDVWARIAAHQGETFHQLKGQPFTYRIEGNALVPSTARVRVQKSQFAKALAAVPFSRVADVPKGVFGPSYVFAVLMDPRIRKDDW